MNDFTFLDEDQLFGNRQLSILQKRGTKAALTDFSILLGAYVSDCYFIDNSNQTLADRTGYYWSSSDDKDDDVVRVVDNYGDSR